MTVLEHIYGFSNKDVKVVKDTYWTLDKFLKLVTGYKRTIKI